MEMCNCCVVVLAYIQILGIGASTWEIESTIIPVLGQPKNTGGYKQAIAKGLREVYIKLIFKFT